MYGWLFRNLLTHLDAESMHRLGFLLLRVVMAIPGMRALTRALRAPRDLALQIEALGTVFPGPVGLAAGFDKDAVGYEALGALGFGFVEVGTLTGEAQPGNPRPRMFRLPEDAALVNRLGFNNGGSTSAVARLRGPRSLPLGINIGKTKRIADEEAIADYVASTERLAALADYLVVNVSSPNTPGLRNLQAVSVLRPLLAGVREAADRVCPERHVPLLVKIAPDLEDADVDAVADLALELRLDGIIATNTTVSREGLVSDASQVEEIGAGGLSGRPERGRSLAVLRRLRARVGARLVLIGVGGISTAEDAFERIRAGATLVQAYTGFVYGGPGWPARIHRELVVLARAAGHARVADCVGIDATARSGPGG